MRLAELPGFVVEARPVEGTPGDVVRGRVLHEVFQPGFLERIVGKLLRLLQRFNRGGFLLGVLPDDAVECRGGLGVLALRGMHATHQITCMRPERLFERCELPQRLRGRRHVVEDEARDAVVIEPEWAELALGEFFVLHKRFDGRSRLLHFSEAQLHLRSITPCTGAPVGIRRGLLVERIAGGGEEFRGFGELGVGGLRPLWHLVGPRDAFGKFLLPQPALAGPGMVERKRSIRELGVVGRLVEGFKCLLIVACREIEQRQPKPVAGVLGVLGAAELGEQFGELLAGELWVVLVVGFPPRVQDRFRLLVGCGLRPGQGDGESNEENRGDTANAGAEHRVVSPTDGNGRGGRATAGILGVVPGRGSG